MITSLTIIYLITLAGYFLMILPEDEPRNPLATLIKSLCDVSLIFGIVAVIYVALIILMILIK
jgi:hypothetical protein